MDFPFFRRNKMLPEDTPDLVSDRTVPPGERRTSSTLVLILLLAGGVCLVILGSVLFDW